MPWHNAGRVTQPSLDSALDLPSFALGSRLSPEGAETLSEMAVGQLLLAQHSITRRSISPLPSSPQPPLQYVMAASAPSPPQTHVHAHLLPPSWKAKITEWLHEDCPSFDWGGYVVGEDTKTATLWCKSPGVVAGVPFFDEVFQQLECT